MKGKRKIHTPEFKMQMALEAMKGLKTMSELASVHQVHPTQIHQWKRQLKEGGREIFARGRKRGAVADQAREAALFEEIGRLKFELDWLKKKASAFG